MRFQDRLIGAYRATSSTEERRFLMRRMVDLPVGLEFSEVVQLLKEEEVGGTTLAGLAGSVLDWVLPPLLMGEHGLDPRDGAYVLGGAAAAGPGGAGGVAEFAPRLTPAVGRPSK